MPVALAGWPRVRRRWWLVVAALAAGAVGLLVSWASAPRSGPDQPDVSICLALPPPPAPPPPPPPIRAVGQVLSIGTSQPCGDQVAPGGPLDRVHYAEVVVNLSGDASFPATAWGDPRSVPVLVPCPELARPAFRLDSGKAGPVRVGGSYGWELVASPTASALVATKIEPNWICRLPHPHSRPGRATQGGRSRERGKR